MNSFWVTVALPAALEKAADIARAEENAEVSSVGSNVEPDACEVSKTADLIGVDAASLARRSA
jgi:hypothetical protein